MLMVIYYLQGTMVHNPEMLTIIQTSKMESCNMDSGVLHIGKVVTAFYLNV